MIAGIENGFTRSGPRSRSVSWQSWNDCSPPMPVAIEAPMRSGSAAMSSPESCLRLPSRRDDHLREAVHPPRGLVVDPVGRVEVLQLAGEVDGVVARVELRDRPGAATARDEVLPRRLARRCRAASPPPSR